MNFTTPESSTELAQQMSSTRGPYPSANLDRGDTGSLVSSSSGSKGKARSSGSRGVHFAEGKTTVGEAAVGGDPGSTLAMAVPSQAGEHLTTELELFTSPLSTDKLASIDEALAEIKSFLYGYVLESQSGSCASGEDVGELLPIGAYHLGVAAPEDDIDTVFVVPSTIQLHTFKTTLIAELEKHKQVVRSVSEASSDGHLEAPGLWFTWRGISVVVLFAMRIPGLPMPSSVGVVQSTAGLTSRGVSEALLACVSNVELFRMLLRFVRFWAKRRGVYGGHFGFFSGTAWAVCCARICQMHKSSQFLPLVAHFFRTMSRWDWSQPVSVEEGSADATGGSALAPAGSGAVAEASGAFQGMTVLLPGTSMGLSATSRVTASTARIMQRELRRGYKLVKQVELARVHWSEVYSSARFFRRHKHYLEFDFMAGSESVFAQWIAWAKKHIENLVPFFEDTCREIVTLRPWPEWLDFKDSKWPHARAVFVGLHLERGKDGQAGAAHQSFDLREPIVKFMESIATWPEADRYLDEFELEIRHVKVEQLEQWLDNREKGLVAHQIGDRPLQQGLVLQNISEKSVASELVDLPIG